MPVLAGHPETAAHVTLTGTALAVFLFARLPRAAFVKAFVASGLLAAGVAAVQMLPTLEWLQNIGHAKDPWPVPPLYSMLGMVSRDIIRTKTVIGLAMPEHAAYMAMMVFIAAPVALLRRPSRAWVIFLALWSAAALSVAYAVGPAYWIAGHIPVFSTLKNSRLTMILSFCLAVLAGLGLSSLEESSLVSTARQRFRALMYAAAGSAVAFMLIYLTHLVPVDEVIEFVRVPRFGLFLLAACLLAVVLRIGGWVSGNTFARVALLLVALDLATVSYRAIPFTAVRYVFPKVALFEQLPKEKMPPFRVAQLSYAYTTNAESMYGYEQVGGYELPLARLKTFLKDLSRDEMDSVMLTPAGVLNTRDRRLDMLNTKYFIISTWDTQHTGFLSQPDRFRFLYTVDDTAVYENLKAFAQAFVIPASGVEVISNEAEQLARIKDPAFDAETHVILSEAVTGTSTGAPGAESVRSPQIEWISKRVNDLDLHVDQSQNGIFVLSQIHYPGWNAYVDGVRVPIVRANYAFPAVFIPSGSHRVRFAYEPWSFKIGISLSLAALLIIGVSLIRQPNSPVRGWF
jgi:hypothetical protein